MHLKKDILCLSSLENVPDIKYDLEFLGNLTYSPESTKKEVIDFVEKHIGCVIFCSPNMMTYRLDEDILSKNISLISTVSTGTDHIDLGLCDNLGIKVVSLKDDIEFLNKISSTAEMAFGLMLSVIRNIPSAFDAVKNHIWRQVEFTGYQLNNLTIGIVGYGRLGTKMCRYCDAFGMDVVICDPYNDYSVRQKYSLKEISERCDIVSLHVHLNDDTKYMIDKDFFNNRVKYLVNTSRGSIVNEKDVIWALENNLLLGYATDVIEDEFGDIENSELIKRSEDLNIIITPHIGGTTFEAHEKAYRYSANRLRDIIN